MYFGVEQNKSYLWGSKFVIRTDNIAIPYLERSKTADSSRAIRWFMKLGEYDYRVEHRKGRTIAHADALSRYPGVAVLNVFDESSDFSVEPDLSMSCYRHKLHTCRLHGKPKILSQN